MKIYRDLISETRRLLPAPDGVSEVKGYQSVFPASLTELGVPLSERASRFWVIIDTGYTRDFAIRESQLDRWARAKLVMSQSTVRLDKSVFPLYEADLWIHGPRGPHLIDVRPGIIVYPDDNNPARLPILGLRAIVRNELKLFVDGRHKQMTISTGDWF